MSLCLCVHTEFCIRYIEFYEFINVMTSVVGSSVQLMIRNRIGDLKGLFMLFDFDMSGEIEVRHKIDNFHLMCICLGS